jgi:hypothetical protein
LSLCTFFPQFSLPSSPCSFDLFALLRTTKCRFLFVWCPNFSAQVTFTLANPTWFTETWTAVTKFLVTFLTILKYPCSLYVCAVCHKTKREKNTRHAFAAPATNILFFMKWLIEHVMLINAAVGPCRNRTLKIVINFLEEKWIKSDMHNVYIPFNMNWGWNCCACWKLLNRNCSPCGFYCESVVGIKMKWT